MPEQDTTHAALEREQLIERLCLLSLKHCECEKDAFERNHISSARELQKQGVCNERVAAWLTHIESLFDRTSDPIVRYINCWRYRYKDYLEHDMLGFFYDGHMLGLLRRNYIVDEKTTTPMCLIETVQGNADADGEILKQITQLRENMFTTFLATTNSLVSSGWNLGLIDNGHNTRLRDRFCDKKIHTSPRPVGRGYWDEYWKLSPKKKRVRDIFGERISNL